MPASRQDNRQDAGSIRLAEVLAALSLATDLGTGQPLEHELGVCLAALELAERLGCSAQEQSDVYYVAILAHLGCSAVAPLLAGWAGGDDIHFQRGAPVLGPAAEPAEVLRHFIRRLSDDRPLGERAWHVATALATAGKRFALLGASLCDGVPQLAERLHLPATVVRAVGQLMERWDGRGVPGALAGEEIARSVRIVRVTVDLVGIAEMRDPAAATDALKRRRGHGYDPQVVDAALTDVDELLRIANAPDSWERAISSEPRPVVTVSPAGAQAVIRALGEFADLKVGFLQGHSTRVAELAAAAAHLRSCSESEVAEVRAAAFVHDLGRVGVPNGIWEKPGPLNAREWERVRLHPYYTMRILQRSPVLAPLASLAGAHHERLDGSGYHRGLTADQQSVGARLLAVADAYDAMTHERPYRHALTRKEARAELDDLVRGGKLDKRAVDAVLQVAGERPTRARRGYPAGLTEREVEVLRLIAQGRTNRHVAEALSIAEKTVGRHVEHIYAKIGVSTRVGAVLFAVRHDLQN